MLPCFERLSSDEGSRARRGRLRCAHGTVETPIFMPVGTQATVKALTPAQLEEIGSQILLGNTYHLHLRPGEELIRELDGLHSFMGWGKPILTDSGGFQVFSLAERRKISDEGISFRSHLDGAPVFLGPRESVGIQDALGSDVVMVLDECPPAEAERRNVEEAVGRTLRWAKTCREEAKERNFAERGRLLFGIVQGLHFADLRRNCAEQLVALDFDGYAIGGVSVGEPEEQMLEAVDVSTRHLPEDRARYVMGVGTPPQLLKMIALGADMFDCVMPTREARHGSVFTPTGKMTIRNNKYRNDPRPLVEGLENYTAGFSRAYLRHLFLAGEILAHVLLTLHNVHFFLDLMGQARLHLERGDFGPWHREWIRRYESSGADASS